MRKLRLIAFVLIILLVPGFFIYSSITSSFDDQITLDQELFYSVKSGSTLTSVANDLAEKEVIKKASVLTWLARLEGKSTIFAAEYSFNPGMTVRELYTALVTGDSLSDETQVTVIEGLYLDEVAQAFDDAGLIDHDVFMTAATSGLARFETQFSFLQDLPEGASLEGYLFPDTYRFFKDADVDDVLIKMLTAFQKNFTQEMIDATYASGKTIHEAVTLASIVQAEVRTEDQMNTVAGIFQNRLDQGMALQTDASINYLTRSGRDRSTFQDLEIESPYNTYKYAGLPPGPIGHPGAQALQAAVYPESTEYFFFLTDKAGRVYYGKTLAEHNNNRQYLDRE